MSQFGGKPIDSAPVVNVLDLDEESRVAYMKSLGARNVDPPLPRSTHLKNKLNGRILPWNNLLAEQRDIMECCDAEGNTDPSCWMPTVNEEEYDPAEHSLLMTRAQDAIYQQSAGITNQYRSEDAVNMNPRPMDYANGAVPYEQVSTITVDDLNNLEAMVEA